MTLRSQFALLAALAVLLGAGWYAWTGFQAGAQSKEINRGSGGATRVLVEPARPTTDKIIVRAVGTGEARRSATIYPKSAGEVTAVMFKSQDRVRKGQVLMRLEDAHQQIAVRLAKVQVKDATRQLQRLEKLAPSGTASQARLETAQTTLESANLMLDQAEEALNDRNVYAPFDGVIGLTEIDLGDRVTTETQIATLDDRSLILVEFELPEEYAGRIKTGDPIAVRPWTMPDKKFEGTVSQLGSRINPQTRTLRVKASIPNTEDLIRPGTSFEVELAFTGKPYPSVREVAVLWSRDGAYLWRVKRIEKDGKTVEQAEKVFVKIVRRDLGRILVDGPLDATDEVVVEGVQGLRPHQRIKAIPFDKFVAGELASPTKGDKKPAKKSP